MRLKTITAMYKLHAGSMLCTDLGGYIPNNMDMQLMYVTHTIRIHVKSTII